MNKEDIQSDKECNIKEIYKFDGCRTRTENGLGTGHRSLNRSDILIDKVTGFTDKRPEPPNAYFTTFFYLIPYFYKIITLPL